MSGPPPSAFVVSAPIASVSVSASAIPVRVNPTVAAPSASAIPREINPQVSPFVASGALSASANGSVSEIGSVQTDDDLVGAVGGIDIDANLAQLRKQKELLELQLEVQRLQHEMGTNRNANSIDLSHPRLRRYDFREIENVVPTFNADDNYTVRRWIADFEKVTDALDCDSGFLYRAGRRLLQGTAERYIRAARPNDWEALKIALLERFDHQLSGWDVREQMSKRFKKRDETYQGYVTVMEEIASQTEGIPES